MRIEILIYFAQKIDAHLPPDHSLRIGKKVNAPSNCLINMSTAVYTNAGKT